MCCSLFSRAKRFGAQWRYGSSSMAEEESAGAAEEGRAAAPGSRNPSSHVAKHRRTL